MLSDMKVRILILCAGFILDLFLGDPKWLPHPVVLIGKLIDFTEKGLERVFKPSDGMYEDKAVKFIAGVMLLLVTVGLSVLVPVLIIMLAYSINDYAGAVVQVFMCYQLLAVRSLFTESMRVYRALKNGDIEGARFAVSMIVGRDTNRLTQEGIIKAAVETVAENTSDGIVAPLFWLVILGVPGMFMYKAVNTLDSMVGYKNEKYMYIGRISAWTDDILNFIPARITGIFMAFAAGNAGYDVRSALRILKRDRKNHASPNSGHPEAAMAGALNISLGGDAWYFGQPVKKPVIGDALRKVEAEDIRKANRIMFVTSVYAFIVGLLVLIIAL